MALHFSLPPRANLRGSIPAPPIVSLPRRCNFRAPSPSPQPEATPAKVQGTPLQTTPATFELDSRFALLSLLSHRRHTRLDFFKLRSRQLRSQDGLFHR